ncbi:hypothetical protein ACFOEY_14775 [Paracandidimonas soli]|uniref:hypothetical protein n=1 Tax=Paracandidimonas soli TaxID=1917182 RepID=UPI00360A8BCA
MRAALLRGTDEGSGTGSDALVPLCFLQLEASRLTTRPSASLVVHDEVKRGSGHTAPQAPPYCGEEAPDSRRE